MEFSRERGEIQVQSCRRDKAEGVKHISQNKHMKNRKSLINQYTNKQVPIALKILLINTKNSSNKSTGKIHRERPQDFFETNYDVTLRERGRDYRYERILNSQFGL